MSEPNKNMKGFLFPNKNKSKATHPDFIGSCTLENKEFRIAGWNNERDEGGSYISLSLTIPLSREQLEELRKKRDSVENSTTQKENKDNSKVTDEERNTLTTEDELAAILKITESEDNSIF